MSQSDIVEVNEEFWTNVKVLIVEDSTTLKYLFDRFVMTLWCKRENIQAVSNWREATSLCAKMDFDLIFMNINMPEMNGDEAAKTIKRRKKGEHIIALTSTEKSDIQIQYFDGYIQKWSNTTNAICAEVSCMESLINKVINR